MEYKKWKDMGIKTEEGVSLTKFLVAIFKADENNALKIKNLFDNHGYDLSLVPGEFLKIFLMNEKEINGLEKNLLKIDKFGLKDYFNINLKVATFSDAVVSRIEFCINNELPYLNEDNSFIKELYDVKAFAVYTAQIPLARVKTVQEIEAKQKGIEMDAEDKQVYNDIMERLNYLVLANPTDEFLVNVVRNIKNKIVAAILRKEYQYLTINEMISNVMFDGLDVSPVDSIRIEELISSMFDNTEERKLS